MSASANSFFAVSSLELIICGAVGIVVVCILSIFVFTLIIPVISESACTSDCACASVPRASAALADFPPVSSASSLSTFALLMLVG